MKVTYFLKSSFFAISFLLIIFTIFVSSAATQSALQNIIIAHIPFLFLLAIYYILSDSQPRRQIFWLAYWLSPILVPMIFFAFWTSGVISQNIDGPNVFVLQILGSLIIGIIGLTQLKSVTAKTQDEQHLAKQYHTQAQIAKEQVTHIAQKIAEHSQKQEQFAEQTQYREQTKNYELHLKQILAQKEHAEELARKAQERNQVYQDHLSQLQQSVEQMKDKLAITQQNFTTRLRGIEDKCKAINYVIGRVYSDKNGGSQDIRELLGISRELYNAFSDQTQDITDKNTEPLIDILEQIYDRLLQLEKEEDTVLTISARNRTKLERTPQNTILEVLARNDKDPIIDYVAEAKEVCSKMLSYLTQTQQ